MRTQFPVNRSETGGRRRRGRALAARVLLALIVVALQAGSGWLAERASAQSADQVFAPDVNGPVYAIAVQDDGKIIIGGSFTQVNSVSRSGLARLFPDGRLDSSFRGGTDNVVYDIEVLPDGSIVIVGQFFYVGDGTTTVYKARVAKFLADGTLDASFSVSLPGAAYAVDTLPSSQLLIGGDSYLKRISFSGSADPSFTVSVNGAVRTLHTYPDGRIFAGGSFTLVNSTAKNRIVRLNSGGTIDNTFIASVDNTVFSSEIQANDTILIAGAFGTVNSTGQPKLARLHTDGSLDTSFVAPSVQGQANRVLTLADGRILFAGSFTSPANGLLAVSQDAAFSSDWRVIVGGAVNVVHQSPDGSILVGGSFTAVNGETRNRLARIVPSSTLERGLALSASDNVFALSHQATGSIVVGGSFSTLGGKNTPVLARLTPSNTVDSAPVQGLVGAVNSVLSNADGSLLFGGTFSMSAGSQFSNLARLNPSGVHDTAFVPNPNGTVYSMSRQQDGSVVVGGAFTQIGGVPGAYLARVSSAGVIDTAFDPSVSATVRTLALQEDGMLLVGGAFATIDGLPQGRLARLTTSGSPDMSFIGEANNNVNALAIQPNGKILIGGDFTQVNGLSQLYLARLEPNGALDSSLAQTATLNGAVYALALQADGDVVVGGAFDTVTVDGIPVVRNHIARFDSDGNLDLNWNPDANDTVYAIALLPDGRVMIGGAFTQVGGQPHGHLAVLSADSTAGQVLAISPDGYSVTWQQYGAGPELAATTFEYSTDGSTYTALGGGSRVGNVWQLDGLSLPLFQNVWVRAYGDYLSGLADGSTSTYASVRFGYVRAVDVLMDTIVSGGTTPPDAWTFTVDNKQVLGDEYLRVLAGTYTVSVVPPPDYALTNVGGACALVSGAIQLTAANNGGNCELTYTRDTGTITFAKVVDGGTAQPSSFSFAAGGRSAGHTQQMTLETGVYTVTESGPTGYAVRAASGACALIDGAIRLTVSKAGGTCTVTNTAPVTFSKVVDGGVSVAANWSFTVAGQPVAHGGQKLLAPGTYTVTESGPTGYTLVAAGGDCTLSDGTVWLTVPAGSPSTATCTLTNRRDQGTITFATTVEGQGATVADFAYTVLGQTRGDGGQMTLDTDLYTVSVTKPSTFLPRVASGACSLVAGALRMDVTQAGGTCAVTFTRLVRFVNVVEGGTRSPAAWSFRVPIDGTDQIVFHNRDVLLAPGTYTVTQQGTVDYYMLANATGNCTLDKGKIIVGAPGSGICTLTNVRKTGGIWFNRIVQGEGSARPEDWVVMVENLPVSMGVTVTLDTDTYTVYESGPTDYALTLAGGICSLYKGKIVLEVTEAGGECLLVSTPGVGPVGFVVVPSGGTAQPSAWEFAVAGQRIPHNGALLMPIGVFPISLVGPADYVVTGATGICSYDGADITMVVGTEGGTCNLQLVYDPTAPDPDPDPGTDPGTDPEPRDAAFLYLPAVQR